MEPILRLGGEVSRGLLLELTGNLGCRRGTVWKLLILWGVAALVRLSCAARFPRAGWSEMPRSWRNLERHL